MFNLTLFTLRCRLQCGPMWMKQAWQPSEKCWICFGGRLWCKFDILDFHSLGGKTLHTYILFLVFGKFIWRIWGINIISGDWPTISIQFLLKFLLHILKHYFIILFRGFHQVCHVEFSVPGRYARCSAGFIFFLSIGHFTLCRPFLLRTYFDGFPKQAN